jgi:hypothetical protein
MKREPGYYWTVLNGSKIIAECTQMKEAQEDYWYVPGREEIYVEREFSFISDHPITDQPCPALPTESEMAIEMSKRMDGMSNEHYRSGFADGNFAVFNWLKSKLTNHGKD